MVELAIDPKALQERETCRRPVYELGPAFEFTRERLHFLVWANNYDARSGDPSGGTGARPPGASPAAGVQRGGPGRHRGRHRDAALRRRRALRPRRLADGIGIVHRWNTEAGSLSTLGHRHAEADLAPDQLAAVSHRAGGARVIAPAGSGKTRVLTERLRHLIEARAVDPSTVTVLAFNRKAADELKERCGTLVTPRGPHIRTLNSVGFGSATSSAVRDGWACSRSPASATWSQRVFDVRRQANTDTVLPYVDALSAVRLGLPLRQTSRTRSPMPRDWPTRFDTYREAMAEAGAADFDEQIYRAIEILLRDPEARSAAQSRCRHLLVDEFQDLNPAHMLLIRLLAAPAYNVFGVGDDDQVIYGYSGATPEYLIRFEDYFPGARPYALEVNYRCPPAVVERRHPRALLQHAADRQDDHDAHRAHRCAPGLWRSPASDAGRWPS